MRDKKSNHRAPSFSVMHLALLVLSAVLLTTHLASGLMARYVSEATVTASARVIRFGDITITETGDFNSNGEFFVIPGVNIEKAARVDFEGSESATYVFVEIKLSGWETTDHREFFVSRGSEELLSWKVSNDWTYLRSDGDTHVYYFGGDVLAYLTPVSSNIIQENQIFVSEKITAADCKGSILKNLSISFRAVAVQSIGFENVEVAWTSVSGKGGQ